MGGRSKVEARKADIKLKFDAAKLKESSSVLARCRSCRKSHVHVKAMVEMGGFVFCDECIQAAATIINARKAGR